MDKTKTKDLTKKIALTAMFTALIAVGAFIKIPIPYVPFSMQFLFCNLAVLMLGTTWGTASIAIYIVMGLIGLPIFTAGGGFAYVLYPTFGYLLGFLIGGLVSGLLMRRLATRIRNLAIVSVINMFIMYICGVIYFFLIKSVYMGDSVTMQTIFISCFLIFLPGDLLWCVLGSIISYRLRRYRLISMELLKPPCKPPPCENAPSGIEKS